MTPAWYAYSQKLQSVIHQHFDGVGDADAEKWAFEIYDSWETAAEVQFLERGDTPAQDKSNIQKAARAFERAAKSIEQVGAHGAFGLTHVARDMLRADVRGDPIIGLENVTEVISEKLSTLAAAFSEVADSLDPNAPSVFSEFGGERLKGSPPKTTAFFTARACAEAYQEMSGARPTRIVDRNGSYGAYNDFLADVFKSLGVEASVDDSAMKAIRFLYGGNPRE